MFSGGRRGTLKKFPVAKVPFFLSIINLSDENNFLCKWALLFLVETVFIRNK